MLENRDRSLRFTMLIFLLVFVSASLLLACRSNDSHQSPGSIEKTKITFWNGFTGPDGRTMWSIVEQFEKEHPQYEVEMELIPWTTYFDKLMVSLGAGNPPDVFVLHENEMLNYIQHDAILPLNKFIYGEQGLPVSDFLESIWQRLVFDEQIFGIPLDCHDLAVYYNKDYFRELGISPPEKLDASNFIPLAKQLTVDSNGDGKPDKWGFTFGGGMRRHFYTLIEQFGGRFISQHADEYVIDTDASKRALQYVYDTVDLHRISPRPQFVGGNIWQGFLGGRIAMFADGIWMMNGLKAHGSFDWGVLPYPQLGSQKAVWGSSHVLCLPKYSDSINLEAAWTFVKYLSDKGVAWSEGGQLPARYSQLQSPAFLAKTEYKAFVDQIPDFIFGPNNGYTVEIETRYEPYILSAVTGQEEIPEMTGEIEKAISSILRRDSE